MALRQESPRGSIWAGSSQPTPRSDQDKAVRVVLVGDHEIVAQGLQAMLGRHPDRAELVGHVDLMATEDLVEVVTGLGSEVALVDLPLMRQLDLVIKKLPFRVVIFTEEADERRLYEALRLGVSGYLLKSLSSELLADHLERVRNGEVVVDPTLATRIAMRGADQGDGQVWPGTQLGLSRRESQVLGLLADGLSNRLIASELVVGEETIKTHLRNIYRKLEVRDRAQAVAVAIRQRLVS
jgi:DNA-binding NarL/FixJ family response regulator